MTTVDGGTALTDLITLQGVSAEEINAVHAAALSMKREPAAHAQRLGGLAAVMLFEKPSLRTRVSFELGLQRIGAAVMYFDHSQQRIGARESVLDYAKNLERFCNCLIARVYDHATLEALAEHASVPVVNALSDVAHPCQALADTLTIREHFGRGGCDDALAGLRVSFVGDGNNVCQSLMLACVALGAEVCVVTPAGYGPSASYISAAEGGPGGVVMTSDPDAVRGSHVVYTDTWVSMGQDAEAVERRRVFEPYRVTAAMMSLAREGINRGPIFMHCLPACRGDEVDACVIDGPLSVVYDQAENRMHAQNALVARLLQRV